MANTINAAGTVGFIIALCGSGILGTSIATMYWRTPEFLTGQILATVVEVNSGLFQTCTVLGCTDISWSTDSGLTLLVTRSILLIACLLIAIGLIIGIVAICGKTDITSKGALDIVSGLFILAACGAYTGLTIGFDEYLLGDVGFNDFGWSFYLCWAASAVFIIAGAFEVNGKQKATGQRQIHPAADMQQQMIWATNMQHRNGTVVQQVPRHQVVQLQ
ncbi:lens fiber membrane intrinsic protein-like [Styela clava]|uniref:uncharacterized protein LOC120331896 n=1 Tax=Styela clava TaxID=7725 RepID=UPI00193A685D|nr:uncharacterized protein LOC120331896 [Styela clava]